MSFTCASTKKRSLLRRRGQGLSGSICTTSKLTIDVEYHSRDREVKQHLLNLLRRAGCIVSSDRFVFQEIGRKSPAHRRAVETLRGKTEPDREIGLEELLEQL